MKHLPRVLWDHFLAVLEYGAFCAYGPAFAAALYIAIEAARATWVRGMIVLAGALTVIPGLFAWSWAMYHVFGVLRGDRDEMR